MEVVHVVQAHTEQTSYSTACSPFERSRQVSHTAKNVHPLKDWDGWCPPLERYRPVPNTVKHVHNVENLDNCHIN